MTEPKCTVSPNGTKQWYADGKLHHLDGPAVEWANGTKAWYVDGKLHRLDGPACAHQLGEQIAIDPRSEGVGDRAEVAEHLRDAAPMQGGGDGRFAGEGLRRPPLTKPTGDGLTRAGAVAAR